MNKIVIICLGQPSVNPRTVKEATALSDAGFDVTVIYNYNVLWADKSDEQIFNEAKNVRWILAGFNPKKNRISYFLSRFFFKLIFIASGLPKNLWLHENMEVRGFSANTIAAKKIKADIYIAHNLGALPAAVKAAKKNKSIYAFDAEDYHRGQLEEGSKEQQRIIEIENKYLPGVSYLTVASPLIGEQYKKHYQNLTPLVINNVFSLKFLQNNFEKYNDSPELKLFWVSQTVGAKRGLETVVLALNKISDCNISLNILGNCGIDYREHLEKLSEKPSALNFLQPVPLDNIFSYASRFHIGLATEISSDLNRDICLTNKLFIYLLSGNCVVASDTAAQTEFMRTNKGIGLLYKNNDANDMAKQLKKLYLDRDLLQSFRRNAHNIASSKLNWETESTKLVSLVDYVLKQKKSSNNLSC